MDCRWEKSDSRTKHRLNMLASDGRVTMGTIGRVVRIAPKHNRDYDYSC